MSGLYVLFGFSDYYPSGGAHDFVAAWDVSDVDAVETARRFVAAMDRPKRDQNYELHRITTSGARMVWEWRRDWDGSVIFDRETDREIGADRP